MDRVVFAVHRYLGPTLTFIYNPLRNIKAFEVIVLTTDKGNLDQFPYPHIFSISELPFHKKFMENLTNYFGRFSYFKKVIKESEPKLIHAHFAWEGIFMLPLKRHFNLPLVTSLYGQDIHRYPRDPVYRWQLTQLFSQGDLFLADSEKLQNHAISLGCPPTKVRTHHVGADLSKFKFHPRNVKRNEEIRILMVGRFVEKKGIDYGIKAFAQSYKRHKNLRLNIIGDGALRKEYEKLIEELGLKKQIALLGSRSYSEYIDELQKSHLLIAPSVVAKNGDADGGIMATVIEAMATGLPCIATIHSGSELAVSGKTGFMVSERDHQELSQKINYLAEHPELFRELGENARMRVEEDFDLKKQTHKLENIYRELIHKH